jgi:cytoskeletal protein CcmA (bactofilin family)
MTHRITILLAGLALLCAGNAHAGQDVDKLNGSIHVASGERMGDLSTVNGSINLAEGASADAVHTVNGAIRAKDKVSAASLKTVNGSIQLGKHGRIRGDVATVNGSITLDPGADVAGHVSNVNGRIRIDGAHVVGGLETTAGDIHIGAGSHIEGGIMVNRAHRGWFGNGSSRKPRIVIGPDAVVKGTLDFQQPVDLYVSDRATVGTIKGATAQHFSGDRP